MKLVRKETHSGDFTKVNGWDESNHKYVDLDCEGWIRENKIRETGRRNGEQDFPNSEATQPDDMHEKIRDWVNQRARTCHAEVSEYLQQQRYNLDQEAPAGSAPIQHKVEALRDEAKQRLSDQGDADRTELTQMERECPSSASHGEIRLSKNVP